MNLSECDMTKEVAARRAVHTVRHGVGCNFNH